MIMYKGCAVRIRIETVSVPELMWEEKNRGKRSRKALEILIAFLGNRLIVHFLGPHMSHKKTATIPGQH